MLDHKVTFLFFAAALACFVLAAFQSSGKGGVGSRGAMARVGLLPLGLAFFVFPYMWNEAAAGF